MQGTDVSIGGYLIQRLQDYGIGHVFGIPGDYVLSFYTMLEQSPLKTVGCTREDCAGFAADAYARVHGMGALCVTYCVGGLERLQLDRRGVCREVAGGDDHRFAGAARAGSQPAVASHGAQFSHAVRRVREALLSRGPSWTTR